MERPSPPSSGDRGGESSSGLSSPRYLDENASSASSGWFGLSTGRSSSLGLPSAASNPPTTQTSTTVLRSNRRSTRRMYNVNYGAVHSDASSGILRGPNRAYELSASSSSNDNSTDQMLRSGGGSRHGLIQSERQDSRRRHGGRDDGGSEPTTTRTNVPRIVVIEDDPKNIATNVVDDDERRGRFVPTCSPLGATLSLALVSLAILLVVHLDGRHVVARRAKWDVVIPGRSKAILDSDEDYGTNANESENGDWGDKHSSKNLHHQTSRRDEESQSRRHIIPTILSVVEETTDEFVHSLTNPLYRHLRESTLFERVMTGEEDAAGENATQVDEYLRAELLHLPPPNIAELYVDKEVVSYGQPLKVSWMAAEHLVLDHQVKDDDIIALFCPADEKDWKQFRDVATVKQAMRSSSSTMGGSEDEMKTTMMLDREKMYHSWDIPSFPVVREDTCQFRLFRRMGFDPSADRLGGGSATAPELDTADSGGDENENGDVDVDVIPEVPKDDFQQVTNLVMDFGLSFDVDNKEGSVRGGEGESSPMDRQKPGAVYAMISTSEPFDILDGTSAPTGIHLAYTDRNSEMKIQFGTGVPPHDDEREVLVPVVEYWERHPTNQSLVTAVAPLLVEGVTHTYAADSLCGSPANLTEAGKFVDPGLLHAVTLTDLVPDTDYDYRVGLMVKEKGAGLDRDGTYGPEEEEGQGEGQGQERILRWSDEFTFPSAMSVGAQTQDRAFQFMVYGDMGVPETGWNYDGGPDTVQWIQRDMDEADEGEEEESSQDRFIGGGVGIDDNGVRVMAVHHFGDLSYAEGASHIWDDWLQLIQPLAARVPYMVGVGNHEYDHTFGGGEEKDPSGVTTSGGFAPPWGNFRDDSNGECGVPASERFDMPGQQNNRGGDVSAEGPRSNGIFWYSYDMASVHVVQVSSEHDLSPSSPQYQWLEWDLSRVDREVTPWIIVECHRPMYESQRVIEVMNGMDENHDVAVGMRDEFEDLLVQYDVDVFLAGHYHSYLRTCDGLYKGVCYNGGPMHITVGSSGAELLDTPLYEEERDAWTEKYLAEWGYGRVTVEAYGRALVFDFVSDTDGTVRDSVRLELDRQKKQTLGGLRTGDGSEGSSVVGTRTSLFAMSSFILLLLSVT